MRVPSWCPGALVLFVSSGCLLPPLQTSPETGDARGSIDAAADGSVAPIGALEGVVEWPPGSGAGGSGPPAAFHVWLTANPADDPQDGGDGRSMDAGPRPCPMALLWRPTYVQDFYPVPVPTRYRFDDLPVGDYCLMLILDEPPLFAPGQSPTCEDPRSRVIPITIAGGTALAPTIALAPPFPCP